MSRNLWQSPVVSVHKYDHDCAVLPMLNRHYDRIRALIIQFRDCSNAKPHDTNPRYAWHDIRQRKQTLIIAAAVRSTSKVQQLELEGDIQIAYSKLRSAWYKGRSVGQKLPIKLKQVWAIRTRLELAENDRNHAPLNKAIVSKLGGCDLVRRWTAQRGRRTLSVNFSSRKRPL